MSELLRFEFRRLFRSRTFYVCLGVSFAVIVLQLLILLATTAITDVYTDMQVAMPEYNALSLLKTSTLSEFSLIAAIFVTIFSTDDFSGDTIKNVCAKGYSREHIFFSKYLSTLAGCMIILLSGMFFQFALGGLMFRQLGTAGQNFALSVLVIVLLNCGYHAIFFAIGYTMRKIGGAIVLAILGPTMYELVASLFDLAISQFAKIETSFRLADFTIGGQLVRMGAGDVPLSNVGWAVLTAAVFIGIFLAGSFFINRKRDF